jgi:gas vesicle protein
MSDQNGGAEFFAGIVIGGLVGAALALLLAPQSGEETRAQIRDKSLEIKDRAEVGVLEARQMAQAQLAQLQEQVTYLQGQVVGLQEKGKQTAAEVIGRGKESVSQPPNRQDNAAEV